MAVQGVPVCQGELTVVWLRRWHPSSLNSFPSHADFEAFFQATVLTLIAVVLVDRTVPVGTTCVGEVSPYAPFEEAFAPFACELAVMFTTRFVPTNHTFDVLGLLFFHLARLVRRRRLCRIARGSALDRRLRGRRRDLRACKVQLAWLRSREG